MASPVASPVVGAVAARPAWHRLGRRGVTTIEFALVATVFLTLMLLTLEVCYDLAVGAALDYGARAASRFGITGAVAVPGTTGTNRVAAIQGLVIQNGGGLLSATHLQMTETAYASAAAASAHAAGTSGPGGSSQVVVYTLTYTQPYLVPMTAGLMGSANLIHTSSVVVLNEPY